MLKNERGRGGGKRVENASHISTTVFCRSSSSEYFTPATTRPNFLLLIWKMAEPTEKELASIVSIRHKKNEDLAERFFLITSGGFKIKMKIISCFISETITFVIKGHKKSYISSSHVITSSFVTFLEKRKHFLATSTLIKFS